MAKTREFNPLVLKHPYPTFEQVRKRLGISKKRALWIRRTVDESIFESIVGKYRISKEDAALIKRLDIFSEKES